MWILSVLAARCAQLCRDCQYTCKASAAFPGFKSVSLNPAHMDFVLWHTFTGSILVSHAYSRAACQLRLLTCSSS